jgi:hypothetical protein
MIHDCEPGRSQTTRWALGELPRSVRILHRLDRALTWGMAAKARDQNLAETLADWEAMRRDQGTWQILKRGMRGIPAAIWARMDQRDITALPAAVAVVTTAVVAVGIGLMAWTYPGDVRLFALMCAIGLVGLGATMVRHPRLLLLRRVRLPGIALATGFVGLALNMPGEADWPYLTPYVEAPPSDQLMITGFIAAALGFALLAMTSFLSKPERSLQKAGILVIVGLSAFGAGQIIWGIAAVTTDASITVTSVAMGLACWSLAHVLPRLRKLHIIPARVRR